MTNEKRTRRDYDEAFKREAVALVTEQGYEILQAARSLGIGANLISRWRRQFAEKASVTRLNADERQELARLRKEVRQLRMETEILKKASQHLASVPGRFRRGARQSTSIDAAAGIAGEAQAQIQSDN
jgi:transposase